MTSADGVNTVLMANRAAVHNVYPKAVMRQMSGWYWITMYYNGPALCAARRSEAQAWEYAHQYVRAMII